MTGQVPVECAPVVDAEGAVVSDADTGPTPPTLLAVLDSRPVPNPDGLQVADADHGGLEPSTGEPAPVVPHGLGRMSEGSAFDWANLLGRDVGLASPVHEPAAPRPAEPERGAPEPAELEPAELEPAEPEPPVVESSAPVTATPVADVRPGEASAIATAGSQRIGDLRVQPHFADDAPFQPSFSMPQAWLSDAPAPLPPDMPRRRAPEDDFFFIDDATPPRWAPPPARALPTGVVAPPPSAVAPEGAVGADDVVDIDEEVDLTQLLEELKQWDPELPEPLRKPMSEARAVVAAPAPSAITPPGVDEALEAAFADLQRQGDSRAVAEQQLAAGRVFLAAGLASEAARAFERASVEPRARFGAAMALAELHRSRGQLREAVGWYEQAAAAPVPDAAVKRPVLYDLAESLDALGETDRAVGVLLDLLSQVEDYRDARARLDRLLRADAGG